VVATTATAAVATTAARSARNRWRAAAAAMEITARWSHAIASPPATVLIAVGLVEAADITYADCIVAAAALDRAAGQSGDHQ
jgi:hypothetical protein